MCWEEVGVGYSRSAIFNCKKIWSIHIPSFQAYNHKGWRLKKTGLSITVQLFSYAGHGHNPGMGQIYKPL